MLRIRLRRVGKRKQSSYRVVVADSRSPRDGKYVAQLGFYNPRTDPPTMELKQEEVSQWLRKGAQPSESVQRMLRKLGILEKAASNEGTH